MHFSWKYQSDITIHQDYLKNTKNLFSSFYSVCEGSSFFPCVCHTYAVRHTTFSILWCHFECDYHHTLNEGSSKSSDQQLINSKINSKSNFSQINRKLPILPRNQRISYIEGQIFENWTFFMPELFNFVDDSTLEWTFPQKETV